MEKRYIITLFIFFSTQVFSAVTLQPIVGYERVQKVSPTPRTKDRAIVGLRLLLGASLLSFEAEATRAEDTESFPQEDLVLEEEAYNAKLGLRSSFNLVFARWFLRAGGHARKRSIERTQAGVTTSQDPAVYVSPYAGTGFSMNLAGKFTANAGVTVIFTGRPKGSDREYQTTFGFGVRI